MKKMFISLLFPLLFQCEVLGDPLHNIPPVYLPKEGENWFQERFGMTWQELEEGHSKEEIDAFLERWRTACPNDPEAWKSSANWITNNAQFLQLGNHDDGLGVISIVNGDLVVENLETGKKAVLGEDQIGFEETMRGVDFNLDESLVRFPYRVDIYWDTILTLLSIDEYDKTIEVLGLLSNNLIAYKGSLETGGYKKLEVEPDVIFTDFCLDIFGRLASEPSEEAFEASYDLALLMTQKAPKSIYGWNCLCVCLNKRGQPLKAIKALKQGLKLNPDDHIMRLNLGDSFFRCGMFKEAKAEYTWVIENSGDAEAISYAKEAILEVE